MKRSLFDPGRAQAKCSGLNKFIPDHRICWGSMNPAGLKEEKHYSKNACGISCNSVVYELFTIRSKPDYVS